MGLAILTTWIREKRCLVRFQQNFTSPAELQKQPTNKRFLAAAESPKAAAPIQVVNRDKHSRSITKVIRRNDLEIIYGKLLDAARSATKIFKWNENIRVEVAAKVINFNVKCSL